MFQFFTKSKFKKALEKEGFMEELVSIKSQGVQCIQQFIQQQNGEKYVKELLDIIGKNKNPMIKMKLLMLIHLIMLNFCKQKTFQEVMVYNNPIIEEKNNRQKFQIYKSERISQKQQIETIEEWINKKLFEKDVKELGYLQLQYQIVQHLNTLKFIQNYKLIEVRNSFQRVFYTNWTLLLQEIQNFNRFIHDIMLGIQSNRQLQSLKILEININQIEKKQFLLLSQIFKQIFAINQFLYQIYYNRYYYKHISNKEIPEWVTLQSPLYQNFQIHIERINGTAKLKKSEGRLKKKMELLQKMGVKPNQFTIYINNTLDLEKTFEDFFNRSYQY